MYIFTKEFQNETTIKIETNNRDFFIGIEEAVNEFIEEFTNEENNANELIELNQIEEWICFQNENRFIKSTGIENEKTNGNEKQNQILTTNNRGNEKKSAKICPIINKKQMTKLYPPINTKYGRAYYDKGYYRIHDNSSPYNHKTLHRLIFEEHYKCTLLPHAIIHHIDGDKTNQDISNLQLMSNSEHTILHNKKHGFTTPKRTLDHNINISKGQNTSGYFRVSIHKANNKQGFVYRYQYYEKGQQKSIKSMNIRKLERKVRAKDLPWQKL